MNIYIRSLKRQYGSNHIVPDTIFWIKKNELLVEICIIIRSLEEKYESNCIVPETVF